MEAIDISVPNGDHGLIAGPPSLSLASAPEAALPALLDGLEGVYLDFDDPRLIDLLRGGMSSEAGMRVSVTSALKIPTVFRCINLISDSIAMLPLYLANKETKERVTDHPLYKVLHRRPNPYQTAFEFRKLMQMRVMTKGNAYAMIVWGRDIRAGRNKVQSLIPLDPDCVTPQLSPDGILTYDYQPPRGARRTLQARDVFHLRNLSMDGLIGLSQVYIAADAIGLAQAAQQALSRLYRNGSFVNGYLSTPDKLTDPAIKRLRQDWDGSFSGSRNAGKTPIFEQKLAYTPVGPNAKDGQSAETRKHQTEEILRVFGVPRPLAMVDETSWGSGIDSLGQFYVQYALGPWFEAWQQRGEASLLSEDEDGVLEIKFNPGGLLRGSLADQGEYFAKTLGSGGHKPWMTQNQVREVLDMPPHPDGDSLESPTEAAAIANAGNSAPAEQGAQANG